MEAKVVNPKRIVIGATGSACGKTSISSALMYMLNKKMEVHAFKCGPDYIDPMYHKSILSVESKNLDSFFMSEELMKASFLDGAGEMNIIEGCMGLYDGIGVSSKASTYEVASILNAPIMLIVDCHGMGASILAVIKGFLEEDSNKLIKGVFLNKISHNFYDKIKPVIEEKTNIKVLGFLPRMREDISIKSRHLGLLLPNEVDANSKLEELATSLEDNFDMASFLEIAASGGKIQESKDICAYAISDLKGKKVLVARDEAFCFYYDDNFKAFEYSGAAIEYFSPLRDKRIPDEVDIIYLGGGYPENHLKELSDNKEMLQSIKDYVDKGGRLLAECGGFMYLCSEVDGKSLAGIFEDKAYRTKGLVRFGYVTARYKDMTFKGHEFHHYDVENPGREFSLEKASTMEKYEAVRRYKNCIAGFPHFYLLGIDINKLF